MGRLRRLGLDNLDKSAAGAVTWLTFLECADDLRSVADRLVDTAKLMMRVSAPATASGTGRLSGDGNGSRAPGGDDAVPECR